MPKALATLKESSSFAEENPTLPDPAPFTGAASCAHAIPRSIKLNKVPAMPGRFITSPSLPDLKVPQGTFPDPASSEVTHSFRKVGDRFEQETHKEGHIYQAVLDYAFGSGDRGKTLVGHDSKGRNLELRLSVYHEATTQAIWDITSGHASHPSSDQGFLGLFLTGDATRHCFSCHVTSPTRLLEEPVGEASDHAIGCEKCHGPGGNHLLAVATKFPDLAIARPSLASGGAVVKICAQCHSPRGIAVAQDDPMSVRFQATTLTWSRCYIASKDKLDCVTCHDPHRDVVTDAAHYEAKCLECHSEDNPPGRATSQNHSRRFDLSEVPRAPTCPVNPTKGCLSCHMPKVEGLLPHSSFSDHFIRVHRENLPVRGK